MVVDNLLDKVEALLFASGRAMTIEQLSELIEEPSQKNVKDAIKKLKESFDNRKSPTMIVEQDNGWKITVREEYLPLVRKIVAETELPKSVLETLAVIAWRAPVLQSIVIKVRTNKAYEHIDELEKLGFISRKKEGRSFRLSLSEKFFEYFDVKGGDIRKMFKDARGIEKELEQEQQKHLEDQTALNRKEELSEDTKDLEDETSGDDNSAQDNSNTKTNIKENSKDDDSDDVKKAIDAEGPHLGNLEVVDSISEDAPEGLEIVDEIDKEDDSEETIKKDSKDSVSESNVDSDESEEEDFSGKDSQGFEDDDAKKDEILDEKEVDEIEKELDEIEDAKEDVEEVLDEASK